MLPRVLKTPTPVTIGVPVHHRANSRCAILLIFKRFGKPFFAKKQTKEKDRRSTNDDLRSTKSISSAHRYGKSPLRFAK